MKHLLRLFAFTCVLLVPALGGCSGGKSGSTVRGTVTMDGKPLAQAEVSLAPAEKSEKSVGEVAVADDNGKFEMVPDKRKLPLLPGKYLARISKWVDRKTGQAPATKEGIDLEQLKQAGMLKNVVPERYSSTDQLGDVLTVEIKAGVNDVKLDVKSK